MSKFIALQKSIARTIEKSKVREDAVHSKVVKKWVLKLDKNASEELQIAAPIAFPISITILNFI